MVRVRVAVTGTPGTGKTTATERLDADLQVVHLNDLIRAEGLSTGEDPDRGSLVADLDAIRERLPDGDVLVESHLAHHLDVDRVVVLRCHPEILADRLRERGADESKVTENAEAEALDLLLAEAVERHGEERVYEIDTTDRSPDDVAAAIEDVLADRREPAVGTVSFAEYL